MAIESSCQVKDTGVSKDDDLNVVMEKTDSIYNVSNGNVENVESNENYNVGLSFDSCGIKLKSMVRNLHRLGEAGFDEVGVPLLCYHPGDIRNNVVFMDLDDMLKPFILRENDNAKASLFQKAIVGMNSEERFHHKVSSSKVELFTVDLERLFYPRHSLSSNIIDFYISW